LTGLQTAGRGGAFSDGGFSLGNLFARRGGGSVGGGLDSLPLIRRRNGRSVYNQGRFGAEADRTNREAQEAILRARVFKQLGIQGTADEEAMKNIRSTGNFANQLRRQKQANTREALTARNLKKLSVGTDKTFDPDFGRAAKAVIGASPTQGLVGLLGLAGAEAFEGQDIKVKERDKLKRDMAKIESNLTAADLAARQAGETSGTAEASAENIRAAEAASKLARDKITEGTKAKDSSRKVVGEQVSIERNMMDMRSTYLNAMKDNKATPDQNPATLKQQGLNEVLGRFNYTIDAQGQLAYIGKGGESLKEGSAAYKKVTDARDKYNTAFAKYLNDAKKARGSLTYLDANNAALFAAKAAKVPKAAAK